MLVSMKAAFAVFVQQTCRISIHMYIKILRVCVCVCLSVSDGSGMFVGRDYRL